MPTSAQQGYATTGQATQHGLDHLPATGLDAGFIAGAGIVLVVLGLWARRLTRDVKRPES